MAQIIVNKENFKDYTFGISNLYEVDSEFNKGQKTKFYYIHCYPKVATLPSFSCISSKAFTEILGENAGKNDKLLVQKIKEHQGEFCIEAITDDDGLPVKFPDSDEIVYSWKKLAHSEAVDWD